MPWDPSVSKKFECQNTLLYERRIAWFNDMLPRWMEAGGIMHGYSKPHHKNLSQKFRAAEKLAKEFRNRRSHQTDSTGDRDESLPLWMDTFKDYL